MEKKDLIFKTYKPENYKNIWLSPSIAIKRLELLLDKCGNNIERILGNDYKHEREAWVGGVFLLALNDLEPAEYWLEIVIDEATPDIYGYRIDAIDGKNHRGVYNIEIVDFEEHSHKVEDLIKKKALKSYPEYFQLLIYARKGGYTINYDLIHEAVKKMKIPFANIFIMSAASYDNDYELVQLYPTKWKHKFNLDDLLEKNKGKKEFATFLQRGSGTEPIELGKICLPLPEID